MRVFKDGDIQETITESEERKDECGGVDASAVDLPSCFSDGFVLSMGASFTTILQFDTDKT